MSWGGIFGSAASLITLFISFLINVPFEVMVGRCVVAGITGSLAGVLVGMVIASIASTMPKKSREDGVGERVDFTVGEDNQFHAGGPRMDEIGLTYGGEDQAFLPLDFKASAKHVQTLLPE